MSSIDQLIEMARKSPAKIVLSEGEDPRIVKAAIRAQADGLADVALVGRYSQVIANLAESNVGAGEINVVDPSSSPRRDDYVDAYFELRKHKGIDLDGAQHAMSDPLGFAAMMVRLGDAEATIGGAVATTSDTLRAALQIIGKAPDTRLVSSYFLMVMDKDYHPRNEILIFADCGLVIEPSAEELAQIAISSAASYRKLVGADPKVAMLSFSTKGSAKHDNATKVADATIKAKALWPELTIGGELQFDAAMVPEVGKRKAAGSAVQGDANVLVFPNLDAANIGYKIAQRLGGCLAIGPILQGLAKPANDLSRGCSVEDVYNLIAITSIQAAGSRENLSGS